MVRAEEGHAWVESQRQHACQGCSLRSGCGGGTLARVFHRRPTIVRVLDPLGVRPGDPVVVGIDPGAMVRGSAAVYAVPMLAMIAGSIGLDAALAGVAGASEWPALAGGLAGLAGGLAWLRRFSGAIRDDRRYQPVVLRRALVEAPLVGPAGLNSPISTGQDGK